MESNELDGQQGGMEIDPKDLRIRSLERRLVSAESQAEQLRREKRQSLITENLWTTVREEIRRCGLPLPGLPRQPVKLPSHHAVEEHLVMHLSDEHADQIVLPHQVGGLEEYNFQVVLKRAETYVDRMLKFTRSTMSNYHFPVLWVLCYGDHVNGEIHEGEEHSVTRNKFANAIAVGQMHALMFRDLASHFDDIKVIYVPGNHGRQTARKDYNRALRSLDYLVAEVAAMRCSGIGNVQFMLPDAHSINLEINGFNFNISHGDDVKAWNGIPWYGIERRNRRLQSIHAAQRVQIHYKVMGHFHQASSTADSQGETIINGSWKATDPYLYNALGGFTEPCQWIHGVHADHGVTWRLPIHLRTPEAPSNPTRYAVQLACAEHQRRIDTSNVQS